jgi:hypothetical protein
LGFPYLPGYLAIPTFISSINPSEMENAILLERTKTIDNHLALNVDLNLSTKSGVNPVMEIVTSEASEDFSEYINWIGFSKEPDLMALSSMHHYYYDHNDMKGVKVLVNLKKLNHIKHLESFLHTLYNILDSKTHFLGCFRSNHSKNNGSMLNQSGKFFNGIINMLDSRTDRSMSKQGAIKLLETHGFKVIDLTEIKGITYFWAQNIRMAGE